LGTEDDGEILDRLIEELQGRIARCGNDNSMWIKLNDRLLKALSMKARQRKSRRGKGFDLGDKP
jgi:hypothetical protein